MSFVVLLLHPFITNAQENIRLEFAPGFSYVAPMPLKISQEGYPDIKMLAHYSTASFKLPIYYSVRAGLSKGNGGWEAEMNHLKIQLKNNPEEIEHFSVSHGYNQIFFSRVRHFENISGRIGIGMVVAHPESIIRGKMLEQSKKFFYKGYSLAGPAFMMGLFKEIETGKYFYFSFSGSVSAAWARIPVSDGYASVPVIAFHLQVAPGITVRIKK